MDFKKWNPLITEKAVFFLLIIQLIIVIFKVIFEGVQITIYIYCGFIIVVKRGLNFIIVVERGQLDIILNFGQFYWDIIY